MKKLLTTFLIILTTAYFLQAQDQPTKCDSSVTIFDDIMKGKITSQVRTAYHYYMNSLDPDAGNTYEQRTANLQMAIAKTFQAFMKKRQDEYKRTKCYYYKEDWNKPGNSSKKTITVQQGFYLLTGSLKRTMNGDWKGGPYWKPKEAKPTSISWKTGGHSSSKTFVSIQAIYKEAFIKKTIIDELNLARKELNDLGIPTEVPPFLEE